jgi:hypothetical protein
MAPVTVKSQAGLDAALTDRRAVIIVDAPGWLVADTGGGVTVRVRRGVLECQPDGWLTWKAGETR